MTLTTAQQVRVRIQDAPQVFDLTQYGDGSASSYPVGAAGGVYRNLTSATAFVPGGNGWTATGATFNVSGYVTFSSVYVAQRAYRVRGVRSTFSDEEIGYFTAVGGTVDGAALEAVETLMFDALKRASWAAPDGTTYDDTRAMDMLNDMWTALRTKIAETEVAAGGFVSWALGQTGL